MVASLAMVNMTLNQLDFSLFCDEMQWAIIEKLPGTFLEDQNVLDL